MIRFNTFSVSLMTFDELDRLLNKAGDNLLYNSHF